MSDQLQALEAWAGVLLQRIDPAARNSLAKTIAQQLRRSQQQRIGEQRNPDGSRYTPRKRRNLRSKKGRVKQKVTMFQKLRTATHLKARSNNDGISAGFTGRIARIARVHQYGLNDQAERGAPDVRYKRRELLGFTHGELDMIRGEILNRLSE
ncbi:phage virion morphogenesis protein [Pseudomonas sp. ES3-33]|uniref:phage virion morphogenesis protein n=1 Tax=Pseudomonas sp. ES3-33 TaxID=1628833 RepID=UPI0005D35A98|nr:phage virion morphogenesis protein [Pseudomonas sp. ES3-33]KJH73923.1 tail protein [Pseudomonas sp. ES3-33]